MFQPFTNSSGYSPTPFHTPLAIQFFRLYANRVPPNLFDRLRYIIQVGGRHACCANSKLHAAAVWLTPAQPFVLVMLFAPQGQDWDFIAHTFWLKHGVALLFDSLYLADGITLAYNSGNFVHQACSNPRIRPHPCLSLTKLFPPWRPPIDHFAASGMQPTSRPCLARARTPGLHRGWFRMPSNTPRCVLMPFDHPFDHGYQSCLAHGPLAPGMLNQFMCNVQDSLTEGVGQAGITRSSPSNTARPAPTAQGQQASESAAEARLSPAVRPDAVQVLLNQCVAFMQEQASVGSETLVSPLQRL